jgi:hypothetical protein
LPLFDSQQAGVITGLFFFGIGVFRGVLSADLAVIFAIMNRTNRI